MDSAVAKDKRIKREIANSNERRRMQSINAGFQKLKRLLPVNDGEKISKANILQHAANYITSVERDRISMYEHNTLIRQILTDLKGGKIDIDSALSTIDSNASTLLSVPLNLQVSMASGSSTPASFPTPRTSPTTPTLASTVPTSTATPKSATISQALFKATTTAPTNVTTSNNTSNNNNNSSENTTTKLTAKSAQRTSKAPRRPSTRNNYKSNNSSTTNNNNNNNNITAITTNKVKEEAEAVGANSNIINNNNDSNPNIGSVTDIISDKIASPKNGLSTPGGATKAAIALPLEVPYTSEIIIGSHQNHHHLHHHHHQQQQQQTDTSSDITGPRKLLKTGTTTVAGPGIDTTDAVAKSNQTLDTICKAIMVIEGDRAYKNEKP